MRHLLLLTALVLTLLGCQEKSLEFMGIPLEQSVDDIAEQLKEKGYLFYGNGGSAMHGTFTDRKVRVELYPESFESFFGDSIAANDLPLTKLVLEFDLGFESFFRDISKGRVDALSRHNYYIGLYTKKYGKPIRVHDFHSTPFIDSAGVEIYCGIWKISSRKSIVVETLVDSEFFKLNIRYDLESDVDEMIEEKDKAGYWKSQEERALDQI